MSTTTLAPRYDDVAIGDTLPPLTVTVRRADLVRYAGASGDFNPIHWNERTATSVGLPNVIAHGMLTMAYASRIITAWVGGNPAAIVEFGVRFTNPVVVPDDEAGATVELTAAVKEKLPDGLVRVEITALSNGAKVLGAARALLRLA